MFDIKKFFNMDKTNAAFKKFGFGYDKELDRAQQKAKPFKEVVKEAEGKWIELDGKGSGKVID